MNKINHLTLITLFLILSISDIVAQYKVPDTTKLQVIKVDPSNAHGARVSELFKKVEHIPLETTKQSLFGTITQLEVLDDRFVIFDNDTRSILLFTIKGKFIKKIAKKVSDGIQDDIRGFTIEHLDTVDYINVLTKNGQTLYDKEGNLIQIKGSVVSASLPKYYVGKAGAYYQQSGLINNTDSIVYQLTLFNGESINYFPLNRMTLFRDNFLRAGKNLNYNRDLKELYYTTYYNYSIFKGAENGLLERYRLILPLENTLPKDFLYNPVYVGQRMNFLKNNPKVVYGIGNIYVIGQKLIIKLASFGGGLKNILCIDLRTNETISLADLEPDASSSFLPVNDAGLGYDFSNQAFLTEKSGWLYTSYSSLAMFKYIQMKDGKNKKYNMTLDKYFKTSDNKSNPIIVKALLRND